jgi:hypothetical protein
MVTWYVFCCPAMTFWMACSGVSGSVNWYSPARSFGPSFSRRSQA